MNTLLATAIIFTVCFVFYIAHTVGKILQEVSDINNEVNRLSDRVDIINNPIDDDPQPCDCFDFSTLNKKGKPAKLRRKK